MENMTSSGARRVRFFYVEGINRGSFSNCSCHLLYRRRGGCGLARSV
jgi:hypothetical protein